MTMINKGCHHRNVKQTTLKSCLIALFVKITYSYLLYINMLVFHRPTQTTLVDYWLECVRQRQEACCWRLSAFHMVCFTVCSCACGKI